jgi:hypothetical protein
MSTSHVRGQCIEVVATFLDKDGAATTPESPVLHYSYQVAGVTTTGETAMTENSDGEWVAEIETAPADDGVVYWTIRADCVATEGYFRLTANPANPTAA